MSEKEYLELKNVKIINLFSELDPNPILRVSSDGLIVGFNKSADEKFNLESNNIINIVNIVGPLLMNLGELISSNKSIAISRRIGDKFYEMNIHGISILNTAQFYFYDLTDKKLFEEQMNIYQKLLKESSAHLTQILEEERCKFAAFLHDSIGQDLLLIRLGIVNIKKNITVAKLNFEFSDVIKQLDAAITEVKEISRSIRPLNIDELGLMTVLASMCRNVAKESDIRASLQLPDDNLKLEKDLDVCLYRVTQEALNNIIKHSRANNFSVKLKADDSTVTLIISDDGIGFNPTLLFKDKYVSDGMGLINMQERVERLNGTFHIDSTINSGTVIIADFPQKRQSINAEIDY